MDCLRKYIVISLWLISAVGICLTGCDTPADSTAYADLNPEGWVYGDTVTLPLRVDSLYAGRNGHMELGLRHTGDYPYSNLWMEVRVRDCRGVEVIDTVAIELCDIYGHWHGHGIGNSFQISAALPSTVCLDTLSSVKVRHIMRVDTLHGVSQVGIMFNPSLSAPSARVVTRPTLENDSLRDTVAGAK